MVQHGLILISLYRLRFFAGGVNPEVRQDKMLLRISEKLSLGPQQNAIDEAFINTINTTGEQTGIVQGKNKPWLQYAMRNNLEGQITIALNNMPAWFTSPQATVIRQTVADTQKQGEVLGQETADTILNLLRRRQALGESIDWGAFKDAYEDALGKTGRKKVAEIQKRVSA